MRALDTSLDKFTTFELEPMGMSEAVAADARKVKVSEEVGLKLEARLRPLLDEWNTRDRAGGNARTLVIKPSIASMHVVSAAARFWAGALSGDSYIDIDLTLVEKETGALIGNQRINRNSNAFAGAWSVGSTDRNLTDYIVDIAYQYLVENHHD